MGPASNKSNGLFRKITGSFYIGGRGQLYQPMDVRKGPGPKHIRIRFEMNKTKYQMWLNKEDLLQIVEDIKAGKL